MTDVARPTWVRYRVLAWLCGVAVIANAQRTVMAVAERPMADELGLISADLGEIKSAFFLGYALFQIPSGLVRDLLGTRVALVTLAVLWSCAVAAMALTHDYAGLMLTWLIAGGAQAGVFPCAVSAIRQWFAPRQRALASGWLSGFMSVGSAVSTGVAGSLLAAGADWRALFFLFALPGLAWAISFGFVYRNRPEHHPRVNPAELREIGASEIPTGSTSDAVHGPTPWGAIFGSLALWMLFAQQFCRAAGYVFFQTWFPRYLQETRGVSLETSGWLNSLPLIAIVIGSPLGGWFSDWLAERRGHTWWGRQGLAAVSLFLCGLMTGGASWLDDPLSASLLIAVGNFCFAFGGPCAYAVAIDRGGRHTSTVFSAMNMSGNLGAFMLPLTLPMFVEDFSWDQTLWLFLGIYWVGACCWLLLGSRRPVYPEASQTSEESRT